VPREQPRSQSQELATTHLTRPLDQLYEVLGHKLINVVVEAVVDAVNIA
jgi:hypothetical protein